MSHRSWRGWATLLLFPLATSAATATRHVDPANAQPGAAPAYQVTTAAHPAMAEPPQPVGPSLLRGVSLALLLAFTGALLAVGWVFPDSGSGTRQVAVVLGYAAAILLAIDAYAWGTHAGGSGGMVALHALQTSAEGTILAVRLALAVTAAAILGTTRRVRWAAMAAVLAVMVSGSVGHAGALDPHLSIPFKALHLLLVAVWLGGLVALISAAPHRPGYVPGTLRVSTIALVAVLGIALSGVVQTLILLPGLHGLLHSRYGILLIGKTAGLLFLVGFGIHNRVRLIPALTKGASAAGLRRSVRWEITLMVLVILLAGFLAYAPVPTPG